MDGWVTPVVKARQAAGELPQDLKLLAVQVLWPPTGPYIVRINSEVRGTAMIRARVDPETGLPDVNAPGTVIHSYDVSADDLDCGHFTMFSVDGRWCGSFNFLTRRAEGGQLLDKAEQFLDAAEWCLQTGKRSACVDNLFSAAELISKVKLVIHHVLDPAAKRHPAIASELNREGHMGNVPSDFVDLFNRLQHARYPERYETGTARDFQADEATISIVRRELSATRDRVRPKVQTPTVELGIT